MMKKAIITNHLPAGLDNIAHAPRWFDVQRKLASASVDLEEDGTRSRSATESRIDKSE
jgi:hypothetical protein